MAQWIATSQFYLYGKKYCTQTGYEKSREAYVQPDILEADDLSLEGKIYIVTGANAGVGREVTTFLAKKKATMYMFCRNPSRAEVAREEIVAETGNENVHIILCDVSLESNVRSAWEQFTEHVAQHNDEVRLDGLVCNAGALMNELTVTSEGLEVTFASHFLFGTYLLTKLAIPVLQATPDSRVAVVSSGGMYNTKFPAWNVATSLVGDYNGNLAYAYAKRGQVLLCEELTKMHPDIKFVTCHPGWTATEAVDAAYGESKKYLEPMRTTWEGAEGIVWLMVAPQDELEGGAFYLDRSPCRKHLGGPFFSDGSFTKNSAEEVQALMQKLEQWSVAGNRPDLIPQGPDAGLNVALAPLDRAVDLKGAFMGRWHVWSVIPTYLEVGARNCIEDYEWDEANNRVNIVFSYASKKAKKMSQVRQRGVPQNDAGTHWKLSVKLGVFIPVGTAYLVLYTDEECQYTIIGVPNRANVWIMARTPKVDEGKLEELTRLVENFGFDTTKLVRPPFEPELLEEA